MFYVIGIHVALKWTPMWVKCHTNENSFSCLCVTWQRNHGNKDAQNLIVYAQILIVYAQILIVYAQNLIVYAQNLIVYAQNLIVYAQNLIVYDQNLSCNEVFTS